jgi:hypothetical protein
MHDDTRAGLPHRPRASATALGANEIRRDETTTAHRELTDAWLICRARSPCSFCAIGVGSEVTDAALRGSTLSRHATCAAAFF